jgi:hypothetical protein
MRLFCCKLLAIPAAAAAGLLLNVYFGPSSLKSRISGRIITQVAPCLLPGFGHVYTLCSVIVRDLKRLNLSEGEYESLEAMESAKAQTTISTMYSYTIS